MTCREKVMAEHPDDFVEILDDECPHHRGYANRPDFCGVGTTLEQCNKCWDREAIGMNKPLIYGHIPGNEIGKVEEIKEENGGVTATVSPIIKDSGDRTEFESGAVRDMHEGKGRMDLLPWAAIMEVSKHCENGAKKYGEHNVDKGIPTSSLCDSAARHLAKYLDGWTDEPHLIAAAWNLLWCIQMELNCKEVVNTPWKKKYENTIDIPQE